MRPSFFSFESSRESEERFKFKNCASSLILKSISKYFDFLLRASFDRKYKIFARVDGRLRRFSLSRMNKFLPAKIFMRLSWTFTSEDDPDDL